jgi:alpha-glucosidase
MMTSLEFNFPHQGYAQINDQFLLGDRLLVAPVLSRGAVTRKVIIPKGKWKSFRGETISGPKTIEVKVQLDDLPYYEKLK